MPAVITWTTARDALGTALAHVSLAADAPAKLIKLGEPETVRPMNYHRIGAGNVEPAFNNRC